MISMYQKWLEMQLKEKGLYGSDPISILTFVNEFPDVCDGIGNRGEVAVRLFSEFMKKLASMLLAAPLSSMKSTSTGVQEESLHLYVQYVNFLLAT